MCSLNRWSIGIPHRNKLTDITFELGTCEFSFKLNYESNRRLRFESEMCGFSWFLKQYYDRSYSASECVLAIHIT